MAEGQSRLSKERARYGRAARGYQTASQLSPAVDVVAYRIANERLANVLRHSAGRPPGC